MPLDSAKNKKTHHKELATKISMVGIVDLFGKLKAFIFIPILSKTLGANSYGIWAQTMVTVTMVLPVVLLGMQFGLARYLPGMKKEEARDDVSSVFLLVLAASFIGALSLAIFSGFLSRKFFGDGSLAYIVKLTGLYLISMAMRELCLAYFRARERMVIYSVFVLVDALFSVVLLSLVVYLKRGIGSLVAALIMLNAAMIIVSFIFIHLEMRFAVPRFKDIKRYLLYSLPFLPVIWLLWVINSSDRYFIGYFKSIKEVGIYSACYGVSYFIVNIFTGPLYLVLQPRIMNAWNSSNRPLAARLINNLVKYALFFMIPSAAGFLMIGRFMITAFTTADFAIGYITVPFILAAYVFYLTTACIEIIIYLLNKSKVLVPIYLGAALINIMLNFMLIPRYGMIGAAISTTLSFLTQLLFTLAIVHNERILKFDGAFLIKVILCSIAMALAAGRIPHEDFFGTALVIICGIAIYGVLALAVRLFDASELKMIKEIFS